MDECPTDNDFIGDLVDFRCIDSHRASKCCDDPNDAETCIREWSLAIHVDDVARARRTSCLDSCQFMLNALEVGSAFQDVCFVGLVDLSDAKDRCNSFNQISIKQFQ